MHWHQPLKLLETLEQRWWAADGLAVDDDKNALQAN